MCDLTNPVEQEIAVQCALERMQLNGSNDHHGLRCFREAATARSRAAPALSALQDGGVSPRTNHSCFDNFSSTSGAHEARQHSKSSRQRQRLLLMPSCSMHMAASMPGSPCRKEFASRSRSRRRSAFPLQRLNQLPAL